MYRLGAVPQWRTVRKGRQAMDVIDRYSTATRLGDPDNVDFWQLFEHGWEDDTFAVLDRYLRPGVTFLDVGAWLGTMTVYAARLCDAVVAVEPDPVAVADLRQHVLANRCGNVSLVEAAVTRVAGRAHLGRKVGGSWGDSMSSIYYEADTRLVRAVTLDDVMPDGCGLVKMDVEGFEAELLHGHKLGCPLWLSTHEALVPDPAAYRRRLDTFLAGHVVVERSGDNVLVLPEGQ